MASWAGGASYTPASCEVTRDPQDPQQSIRERFLAHTEVVDDPTELDPGPEEGRFRERFLRRHETVGFVEAATTTAAGRPKRAWDWIPVVATGREGARWVDLYGAAEAYEGGTQSADQRRMLEDFVDWHARERGFLGGVGEIAGDLPVFAVEFGAGLGFAKILGSKVMATVAGQRLQRVLTKIASTRVAGALQGSATARTVGKLASKGAAGTAILAVSELPRAPWGRVMANARRLQFQRRFGLTNDEAGQLVVETLADPQSLIDVLPTALLDELIEYGSEMTGPAIPFVAKIDALHDDILAFFFSKRGIEEGRKFLAKYGIGGVWSEIGEEYIGAGVRETIGQLGGPPEFKGQLPETFGKTLEMYVAFGLRGGVGAAKGAFGEGVRAAGERAMEKRMRHALTEHHRAEFDEAGVEYTDEQLEQQVEEDMKALREARAPETLEEREDITEEELEALEAMEPEEAEEILREKGYRPVEEEEAPTEEVSPEEAEPEAEPEEIAPEEEVAPPAEPVVEPEEQEPLEPRPPETPPEAGRGRAEAEGAPTSEVEAREGRWEQAIRDVAEVLTAREELAETPDSSLEEKREDFLSGLVTDLRTAIHDSGLMEADAEPNLEEIRKVAAGVIKETREGLQEEAPAEAEEPAAEEEAPTTPEAQEPEHGTAPWPESILADADEEERERVNAPDRWVVEPGKPARLVAWRGSGREERGEIYAPGTEGPTLGPGRYGAATETRASAYGPQVERYEAEIEKAALIESDDDLVELHPDHAPVPYDNAERIPYLRAVRENLESQGYTGVVVNVPLRGDFWPDDAEARPAKRLREIFGESQVIEFGPAKVEAQAIGAPEAPGQMPEDATDEMVAYGDESALGEELYLELPNGKALPAVYTLTDATYLTPTHDPNQGFKKNPQGDLNERPYEDPTEGKASRETVHKIASDLKPALLVTDTPTAVDGPPIVTRWGVVLGGNARAMALQLAHAEGGKASKAYTAALKKAARRFGLSPEDVDEFEQPVLVRELAAGQEGKPGELSRILNQALTTPKTAIAEAVSRGREIGPADAQRIAKIVGEETLGKVLSQPGKATDLLNALIRSGAFVEKDLDELTDSSGKLTKAGRATVEETLLGAVVADVRALASLAPGHRNKLIAALPSLVRLRIAWPAFTEHLVETADALASLRASKQRIADALVQSDIEAESWKLNEVAVMLAGALQELGPRQFASRAQDAVEAVQEAASGQAGLWEGAVPAEPWEALRAAFGQWETDLPSDSTILSAPSSSREHMRGVRAARAPSPSGVHARPHGTGTVTPAPPARKKGRKTEPVVTKGDVALDPKDMRVERTHAVLRRFGIIGRDDPIAITESMTEARLAAEGLGEVDLQTRDNIYQIINDLARRFGLGLPGTGKSRRLRQAATGFYRTDSEGIRLRKSSYLVTFFHELGHHVHKVMFPRRGKRKDPVTGKMTVPAKPGQLSSRDFPVQWREELVALGKDLYGEKKPKSGYAVEGWAQVMQFLITDPAHLQNRAPALYAEVIRELQHHHPEVWLVLQDARQRFRAWLLGSEDNPVAGFIQRGRPPRATGKTARDRWTMEAFDRRVRVRTALEHMGVMEKIPFHKNPYWTMRRVQDLQSGDLLKMLRRGRWDVTDPTQERTGKSLQEILGPCFPCLELWEEYAVAKRVREKRDQGFDVLPADPDADVTAPDRVDEFIARVEQSHPEIVLAHEEFQEFNRWVVEEYAVHHDLITPEVAARVLAANQEYITFRYATTDDALRKAGGSVGSFVNLGSGIRWFKNSQGDPLLPPLPAYIASLEGVTGRAHHNAGGAQLFSLEDDPELGQGTGRWWQRIPRPMKGTRVDPTQLSAEVKRQLGIREGPDGHPIVPGELAGMDEGELATLVEMIENFDEATFWSPSNDIDEEHQVVRVLIKGKPRFYQVNAEGGDLLLWKALKGFYNPVQLQGTLRLMTLPARVLRGGATQYNISFGLMNVLRDVWMALTLTTTMLRHPTQIPDRLRGIKESFIAGDWAALYEGSGAPMQGLFGGEMWNERTKTLDIRKAFEEEDILHPETRKAWNQRRPLKALWEGRVIRNVRRGKVVKAAAEASLLPLAGRLNTRLERATRMGEFIVTYKQLREAGVPVAEARRRAGHAGANVTLDFAKGGRSSKVVNEYWPFFNAAMLGIDRLHEYLKEANHKGPGHLLAAFFRISGFMVVPSVLQFLMVWDDEDYWNIDQRRRDRYWYMPTGRNDHGAKTYLRIPKPYGLAAWSILAERSFARAFGINPLTGEIEGDPEAWEGMWGSILSELSPTFSIAGIMPVWEVMSGTQGYDFYWDNEIVPTRDRDLPVGMRGAEQSSLFARAMGEALGYAPAKIDHLIYGLTAGAGKDMVRTVVDPMVGWIVPSTKDYGEPFRREDLPIIRRFFDAAGRGRTEAVERFYEEWKDVDEAKRGLNRLRQMHGKKDRRVEAFEARHRYDLERYGKMSRARTKLSKLFSELRRTYRDVVDVDELEREIVRIQGEIKEAARKPFSE